MLANSYSGLLPRSIPTEPNDTNIFYAFITKKLFQKTLTFYVQNVRA
jgi:hypothetical protein